MRFRAVVLNRVQPRRGAAIAAAPGGVVQQRRAPAEIRHHVARFFSDLRRTLGITQHQAAAQLLTHHEVIDALENGYVGHLPPWPETVRIVMAYAGWAGVDGRPALAAMADLIEAAKAAAPQPRRLPANAALPALQQRPAQQQRPSVAPMILDGERLRRAGTMIAQNARRLPIDAIQQARQRPVRALYAVSLPVAALILLLNASLLHSVTSLVSAPFSSFAQTLFGDRMWPSHDGFRWIDVADPRTRRDGRLDISKLQKSSQPD